MRLGNSVVLALATHTLVRECEAMKEKRRGLAKAHSSCSAPCTDDREAWLAQRIADLGYAQTEGAHAHQLPYERTGRAHFACPQLIAGGVSCTHLPRSLRSVTAWLLQERLRYTGRSAEVGVWMGEFSLKVLRGWPLGSRHFLVDPWQQESNCSTASGNGNNDKHCTVSNRAFEKVYQGVVQSMSRFSNRITILREDSSTAAEKVEDRSLDHIYIDARHDHKGVSEDLNVWWDKLCPGGLFAGHDFTPGWPGVVRAVTEFMLAHKEEVAAFSITADGGSTPPTWLVFRTPVLCQRHALRASAGRSN